MRKIVFIFIVNISLLLQCMNGLSQNVFDFYVSTSNEDRLSGVVEKSNGNFIFIGTKYNDYYSANEINGYLIEVDSNGNVIKEKDAVLQDTLMSLHDIVLNDKGGYYVFGAIGTKINGYTDLIAFIEFDNEFNIIEKHLYDIPKNRKSPSISVLKNENNNFVLYGSVLSSLPSTYSSYPLFLEISENGEIVNEKYHITTDDPSDVMIFDIIEKHNNYGYFALTQYYPDYTNLLQGRVLNLDENFELNSYIYIPNNINNAGTLKWFTDTTYILSGTKNQDSPVKAQDNDIGMVILDTLGNEVNLKYIGKPDTTDFPGFFSNFDFSADNSSIFVAGTQGFVFNSFPNTTSKIALTKVDTDLNIIWEKFYGGDAYYIVLDMKATNDGGCIILSSKYDYETQNNEDDMYVLKVDSNGNNIATSIDDELNIEMNEIIVFPNPTSYEIIVRTAIQQIGGTFYLFDISGKQIIQTNINNINTTINISKLPSGIYLYKYFNNSKIVGNGKLIKK